MKTISNARGAGMISVIIASAVIVMSILGVGTYSLSLSQAMRKTEIVDKAVILEAALVHEFNNKANFPDGSTITDGLRDGTLAAFQIIDATYPALANLTIPIQTTGANPGVVRYLDRTLVPCGGSSFSATCVLKYEVRLKKQAFGSIQNYSFSYQIEANPELVSMAPLGRANVFNHPIDPGNYRVRADLTKCDPSRYLFMTGMNRDTGEAYCVEKPLATKCPDGRLPKGFSYQRRSSTNTTGDMRDSGVMQLDCTATAMKTLSCPVNYSLYKFNPQSLDPENPSPGPASQNMCVFRSAHSASLSGSYPPNPSSPYLSSVSGTFCPPYYSISNGDSSCHLIPNTYKNASSSGGLGKCATTYHKDCHRTNYTDVSDGGAAYNTWSSCMASGTTATCGSAPANPVITRTCTQTQTSPNCDGQTTTANNCTTIGAWDSGTAYAGNFVNVQPSAVPVVTVNGRQMTCGFQDTSPICSAPSVDINGQPWGKKSPVWYGGVQVSGVSCVFTPAPGVPEEVVAY